MCSELEDAKHVILGCGETAHWRMNLKWNKWLTYHKENY
jgi:siroheme synthase (precorrin-2 oxidase/ferrochelatase)